LAPARIHWPTPVLLMEVAPVPLFAKIPAIELAPVFDPLNVKVRDPFTVGKFIAAVLVNTSAPVPSEASVPPAVFIVKLRLMDAPDPV